MAKIVKPKDGKAQAVDVRIPPPNMQSVTVRIRGTAPLVQNKFSAKAREKMIATQEAGTTAQGKKKSPKEFRALYDGAIHRSADGWCGLPAAAFRAGMISACRLINFKMTLAKLAIFIEADGVDEDDGTSLVRILKGEPHYFTSYVRNETGVVDIRPRPMWNAGWESKLRVRYDGDIFGVSDVVNLLMRVGAQVGIGEGRPDSKKSAGMGWGLFEIVNEEAAKA